MINMADLHTKSRGVIQSIRAVDAEAATALTNALGTDDAATENAAAAVRRMGIQLEQEIAAYARAVRRLKNHVETSS